MSSGIGMILQGGDMNTDKLKVTDNKEQDYWSEVDGL